MRNATCKRECIKKYIRNLSCRSRSVGPQQHPHRMVSLLRRYCHNLLHLLHVQPAACCAYASLRGEHCPCLDPQASNKLCIQIGC